MVSFIEKIAGLLFPDHCLGCSVTGSIICQPCLDRVHRNRTVSEDGTISLFPYHDPLIRKALWALKYHHKKQVAEVFSEYLHEELIEELAESSMWQPGAVVRAVIVPVPASKKRARRRGFNQAAAIARSMSIRDTSGILEYRDDILLKMRETESQVSMKDRNARLANARGSFCVKVGVDLTSQVCVVVDDVTTTGATLREARRALRDAGARRVLGITIAT